MVQLFAVFNGGVAIYGVGSDARFAKLLGDMIGMVDIDAKGDGAFAMADAKPFFNDFFDTIGENARNLRISLNVVTP